MPACVRLSEARVRGHSLRESVAYPIPESDGVRSRKVCYREPSSIYVIFIIFRLTSRIDNSSIRLI